MDDVVSTIGPSLRALDEGQELALPTGKTLVCAFTMAYTGDMPQQQSNAGMLHQSATFGCRACYATDQDRGQLSTGWELKYHYENERIHQYMISIPSKINRAEFGRQYGMAAEPAALQKISLALDIIMSRPGDPAHSEFNCITNMLHELLLAEILAASAKLQYAKILREEFPLPPGWGYLRSPLHYLGTYSLSKHARWSVIAPIFMRVWLQDEYIQPEFLKAMQEEPRLVMPKQFLK
ncbi:hypothetical protein AC579_8969 [Pseudocercospora musae]|uniref:Uncharacterized protein n=1 Tax=Pseudocercospora musae TaxID=113226 RepID=A0A139HNW7_9PEZI|nr:hypothetical protein AC579_8969 [Pseudocercospora musae]